MRNDDSLVEKKKSRKINKKKLKRKAAADEVIFIFEQTLKDRKTTQILNEIKRNNPRSSVDKKSIERIMTGNSKVFSSELNEERYDYYKCLREEVYKFHKNT